MSTLNLLQSDITVHDGSPVRLVYDHETDILEIFWVNQRNGHKHRAHESHCATTQSADQTCCEFKQPPPRMRRNELPVKCIGGALGCAMNPWRVRWDNRCRAAKHRPAPRVSFLTRDGVEVVPTIDWQVLEVPLTLVIGESRVELVSPTDPATIDDHHDIFASLAKRLLVVARTPTVH